MAVNIVDEAETHVRTQDVVFRYRRLLDILRIHDPPSPLLRLLSETCPLVLTITRFESLDVTLPY